MRNLLILSLLLLFGNVKADHFKVEGTVEISKGEIFITVQRANGVDTLAKTVYDGGKFVLEGEISQPEIAVISLKGYSGGFMFFLDTDATVRMDLKNQNADIKGGKLQTTYQEYLQKVAELNQGIRDLQKQIEEESASRHFRTVSELEKQLGELNQKNHAELEDFLGKHADNLFGTYIRCQTAMQSGNIEYMRQMYESLPAAMKQTEPARFLMKRFGDLSSLQIGQQAPDFVLPDKDGKEVRLSEVKGKIKIIDFWASWCGPCRLENPNMVKLYKDFKDKGLEVISVSLDTDKRKWLAAVEKDGLNWIQVSSLKGWKCDVVKRYDVDGVPFIWVLDENNRILTKQIRGEALRAFVSERL